MLSFWEFGRTTERHAYGGETSHTTKRLCIWSEKSGRELSEGHQNSRHRLIGLIQCHLPPLAKCRSKWDFEHSGETVRSLFSGRAIDPFQINFEQLRSWYSPYKPDTPDFRNGKHFGWDQVHKGAVFEPGSLEASKIKTRVIDIHRGMVRDAPENCSYAALSYVWGQLPQLTLTKSTYKRLTKKGALCEGCADLSLCVKDAMTVCEKLGLDFLWVDALCIRQDDPDDRKVYIENMGAIYSQAVLTIVMAAGKDTSTGLPGVRPNTRKMRQEIEIVGAYTLSPTITYDQAVNNSVWATRGWTFQERELSHELLIFTDYQVFFQSRKKAYREDTFLEMTRQDVHTGFLLERDLFLYIKFAGGLMEYTQLVSSYTRRHLSYTADIDNAFRGIVQSFGEVIELTANRFLWALPAAALDYALCWEQVPEDNFPQERVEEFPSWSWLGWIGGKIYSDHVARPSWGLRAGKVSPFYDQPHLVFYDYKGDRVGLLSQRFHSWPIWKPSKASFRPGPLPNSDVPQTYILRFWTSYNKLRVRLHKSQRSNYDIFHQTNSDREIILGRIMLDPDWVEKQPNQELHFIVIASQYRSFLEPRQFEVQTLCVEPSRELGVIYRVNKTMDPIKVEDWMATGPLWKSFALA
jgi:hypothetical protein